MALARHNKHRQMRISHLPIRVMLVDDHPFIRDGLRTIFEVYDDVIVVGEAANGQQAVKLCNEVEPDVILMDLSMPVMDGIEATQIIKDQHSDVDVIVLTADTHANRIERALQAGASCFLFKDSSIDQVVEIVRQCGHQHT